MNFSRIRLKQVTFEFHPHRVLWIPEYKLLCASDLHLEKGSFFSRFSTLLPPYDSNHTLERLAAAIDFFKPELFIALGDSFHDQDAGARLDGPMKELLSQLIHSVPRWVWILGNHDPDIDENIGGERNHDVKIGELVFRHEIEPGCSDIEISGHFHPKADIFVRSHRIGGPCFVRAAKRIIMPAFGSYTGGLSVYSRDFTAAMKEPAEEFFLIHGQSVYRYPFKKKRDS